MLKQFTDWLWSLVVALFTSAWQFLQDAFIAFFALVVNAFVGLVASIPVPSFLSTGLGGLFANLDSGVLWICTQLGIPAALTIIGSAYAFRMLRKFVTLFQW